MSEDAKAQEVKLTQEDVDNLSEDLQTVATTLQSHDQSIFQIVASLNATQRILVEKGLVTEKELVDRTEEEMKSIHQKFMEKVKAKQTTPKEKEESSVIIT